MKDIIKEVLPIVGTMILFVVIWVILLALVSIFPEFGDLLLGR